MNGHTSPREELARIIDPVAFQWIDQHIERFKTANPGWTRADLDVWIGTYTDALAKADEWLSRPPVKAASLEREVVFALELIEDAIRRCALVADQRRKIGPIATQAQTAGSSLITARDRLRALSLPVQSVEGIAIAYYDGFVDGIMREPWEAAADYAAVMGQAYAKTGERPPFIPVTGPGPDKQEPVIFDIDQFGQRIFQKLKSERLSYRTAAPLVGVSSATLHRCASGRGYPDVESYFRIEKWLSPSPPKPSEAPAMGWKLVPVEPTDVMLSAGSDGRFWPGARAPMVSDLRAAYSAMVLAASTPESAGQSLGDASCPVCGGPDCIRSMNIAAGPRTQPALGEREVLKATLQRLHDGYQVNHTSKWVHRVVTAALTAALSTTTSTKGKD